MPVFWSALKSRYWRAHTLRGIGAAVMGRSAPFCNSSSATGKGLRAGCGVDGRTFRPGDVAGDADAEGKAGSAAARAKNTACVPRDLSRALGFARKARAYNTFWMSFFLTEASSVSSGLP